MITFANFRMFFLTFMLCFLRMRYILHPPTVAMFQKVDTACTPIASLSEPTDLICAWVHTAMQGVVFLKPGTEKETKK